MAKYLTRRERALITEEKIYNAAIELFEDKGYENTSIEDITSRAGTAKGTFYIYFDSKNQIIRHTTQRYDDIARQTYQTVKNLKSFREQFIEYMRYSYRDIKVMGREILKALYWDNLIENEPIITVPKREIYNSLNKIVEYGLETGELSKANDVDFYMNKIIIILLGIDYFWCSMPSGTVEPEELAVTEATALVNGLINLK